MFSVQFHVPCYHIDESFFVVNHIELQEAFNSSQVNALKPDIATQIEFKFLRVLILNLAILNLAELKLRAALDNNIVS
jgi:hypothetical protein